MGKQALKTWSTPVTGEKSRVVPCTICGGNQFKPHLSCEGFAYVRCTGCGLVQVNPQPLISEVEMRYQEAYGEDYLAYELDHEAAFLRLQDLALADIRFEELEQDLKAKGQPSILDIGCATGALLNKLREQGWAVQGVEICAPSAEYARRVRHLDIHSLTLEENHFPDKQFDVVHASHLIEHLNDPGAFVREVYRILRPDGYFLVTTPNIAGFQAQVFKNRWRSAIFDHLYLFSIKTLSKLLIQSGFEIDHIVTWGGLAAGTVQASLKSIVDKGAKWFGFGDVMLIKAWKPEAGLTLD